MRTSDLLSSIRARIWPHSKRAWEWIVAAGVIIGLVTGLPELFRWFPTSPPKLSLALYDTTSDGRRYIQQNFVVDGKLDTSQWPNAYVTAPIRIAIRNLGGQETLESVRVRLIYDPSVNVISTAQERVLRSGEIAYEQPLGVIERDDEYSYLPLVDTLKIASWVHGEEVIALSRDQIPTLLRVVLIMPYSGEQLNSSVANGRFVRDVTRHELHMKVIVSSANRADADMDVVIHYDLGVQMIYPPANVRTLKIQVDPARLPKLPSLADLICDGSNWTAPYPETGRSVDYKECRQKVGPAKYQLIAYDGHLRMWIVDSSGTGLVDTEWFVPQGSSQPSAGLKMLGKMPTIHWSKESLAGSELSPNK